MLNNRHETTFRYFVLYIPFVNKELVISRIEWFGPVAILQRYEYVWQIQDRKRAQ